MVLSTDRQVERSRGLRDEQLVITWLKQKYQVIPANRQEQIEQDIDCHVITGTSRYSLSIKSQLSGVTYKNIGLELVTTGRSVEWTDETRQLADDLLDKPDTYGDEFNPAWFLFGKADKYLFLLGNKVILIDKQKLIDYVRANKFDYYRRLNRNVAQGEGKQALNGFVYWKTLVDSQVPHKVAFVTK